MPALAMLFGVAIFLFWWRCYPQALSYREQYQLFLFTPDYFFNALSIAGGLADYLGEFLTQFFILPWAGALIVAVTLLTLQSLVWRSMNAGGAALFPLSFIPSLMLIWLASDESMLFSLPVAIVLTMAVALLMRGHCAWADIIVIPALYWLMGPMAWTYVLLRNVFDVKNKRLVLLGLLYLPLIQLIALHTLLQQWPLQAVMLGLNYSMVPLHHPAVMIALPFVIALLAAIGAWAERRNNHPSATAKASQARGSKLRVPAFLLSLAACIMLGIIGVKAYDKDRYELIMQDYLVRWERWDDIIRRAERYQVRTPFSSVCINLALSQQRQLADRMFDFYQSGTDALIMPRVRDLTSMLPTAEAYWRLGMVNAAQRYMFDTQESILNGKKSGRCTRRIAECMLVNGHYKAAAKQISWLKKSLFYRPWAEEAERLLGNEAAINAHPVYGRLRQLRYKKNYLFSYDEIDKMLGLLYVNNNDNLMALDYFMGQLLLKGQLQAFMQYLPMAQQQGGYRRMPLGYQDAMYCIQRNGAVQGSPYREYVRQQTGQ